jgi:hypothetical protein
VEQSNGGRDDKAFAKTRQHGISVFHIFLPAAAHWRNSADFSAKFADSGIAATSNWQTRSHFEARYSQTST